MIEIYLKNNTNYQNNGDITLDPTACTYKDSQKELTLEHFIDDEGRWKYIEFENVIAVEENEKKILYRIYNVVRSLYNVTAYARPIFYDLIDTVLLDVRPTEKIAQEALDIILDGTGFKGHSNLASINTSYYIRKNIVEALLGDIDNSFLNRWGGEFYCENFDIYINDRIGSDNGVRVEFGYNLNEIEEDINIEDVVTRIIPVGFDGIMLAGDTPWIDSPLINKYTHVKMRVIGFSDVKVKEHIDDEEGFNTIEEARAELVKRCKQLLKDGIDKPTVNYKIDMINLANTTAYEDFKMLVNVNKGDTVTCYIPHLDIDVQARVIDFEKDLLTGEYISIELGNVTNDFFKDQSDINNKIDNIFNSNGNVKAETLEGAINALQAKFKALRDVAQPQQVRAILFEDRIEDSPSFGAMAIGTIGFEIASSFKPGTTDWDFRTFGTGKGFVADHIITGVLNASLIKAGILESENGKSKINMKDGTFNFADKIMFDGSNFTIDLSGKDLATNKDVKDALILNNTNLIAKFSSSGGYNVVKNSGFKNGLAGWWKGEYQPNGTNRSIDVWGESSQWILDGTRALCMQSTNNTSGEFRVDSQKFKVKRHTNYTLSYLVAGHRVTNVGHYVRGNEWEILASKSYVPKTGGKNRGNWTRITQTFNTDNNHQISINFIHFKTNDNAYSWITDVMINEGDVALPWSPYPFEIYEGYTKIDRNGVEIGNGALTVINSNGVTTIDGSKLMFRLKTWGNGSITLGAGETTKRVTIRHGLGYSPVFKGQFRFANNNGIIETYENNITLLNWATGTVNINGRMWVDDSNIYISIWRSSNAAGSGQQTFYYRYFIEEGVKL